MNGGSKSASNSCRFVLGACVWSYACCARRWRCRQEQDRSAPSEWWAGGSDYCPAAATLASSTFSLSALGLKTPRSEKSDRSEERKAADRAPDDEGQLVALRRRAGRVVCDGAAAHEAAPGAVACRPAALLDERVLQRRELRLQRRDLGGLARPGGLHRRGLLLLGHTNVFQRAETWPVSLLVVASTSTLLTISAAPRRVMFFVAPHNVRKPGAIHALRHVGGSGPAPCPVGGRAVVHRLHRGQVRGNGHSTVVSGVDRAARADGSFPVALLLSTTASRNLRSKAWWRSCATRRRALRPSRSTAPALAQACSRCCSWCFRQGESCARDGSTVETADCTASTPSRPAACEGATRRDCSSGRRDRRAWRCVLQLQGMGAAQLWKLAQTRRRERPCGWTCY